MIRTPAPALRRRRILAGTAVAIALLAGVVALTEALRHPGAPPGADVPAPGVDPRDTVACPDPEPREGVEREDDAALRLGDPPLAVGSGDLLNCPEYFNGRTVRYEGEVVGGLLRRDGGAWAQLNDDVYARSTGPLPAHRHYRGANTGVGVFLPAALVEEIGTVGGPGTRGDLLAVEGVFHRVDPATYEVAVIQVRSAQVVEPGEALGERVPAGRWIVAGLLVVLALAAVVTERDVARRRRR